ncbi:hypothetical protein ABK040_012932 [Willaertia magna]
MFAFYLVLFLVLLFLLVSFSAEALFFQHEALVQTVNSNSEASWKATLYPQFSNKSLDYLQTFLGADRPFTLISLRAFSSTTTLSDRFCIASKGRVNVLLSPEFMLNCNYINGACTGGNLYYAYRFLTDIGVPADFCTPYTSYYGFNSGTCPTNCTNGKEERLELYRSKHFELLSNDENEIKMSILSSGPVQGGFDVYEDFYSYKSGVYSHLTGQYVGRHAVRVVGWGVDQTNNLPFWIIANSWGSSWGEGGFFRMKRGNDECGIESEKLTVEVDFENLVWVCPKDSNKKMISELVNKRFLVAEENKGENNNKSKEIHIPRGNYEKESIHEGSMNDLALGSSPPSLGSSPPVGRKTRSNSLSKSQLEIKFVYDKINNSPIFNLSDKLLEKNQKAIQLSNNESICGLYFSGWMKLVSTFKKKKKAFESESIDDVDQDEMIENNNLAIEDDFDNATDSNKKAKKTLEEKHLVTFEFIFFDIDEYPFYFPLNFVDSGDLLNDYLKFGVRLTVVGTDNIKRTKTFIWLEDGLIHPITKNKQFKKDEFKNIKFNSVVIKTFEKKFKLFKLFKNFSNLIAHYNIHESYHQSKGGSLQFCEHVISKFTTSFSTTLQLTKNLKSYFKQWKKIEKNLEEDKDEEYRMNNDPFFQKNEHIAMDDLSNIRKNALKNQRDIIRENLIKPSPYEIIFEKIDYLIYPFTFKSHLKESVTFNSYEEFNNYCKKLFEIFPNYQIEHSIDYLYLKIIDRLFWCLHITHSYLIDPIVYNPNFVLSNYESRVFSQPIVLEKYFGNIETIKQSISTDFISLRKEKKGDVVKVLSLDGGGMRGLVLVEQLIEIERKSGKRIQEMFDIVCGTSTGGIIATMIQNGFSMEEIRDRYMQLGFEVFNLNTKYKTLTKAIKFFKGKSWYESKILEKHFTKETGGTYLYSVVNSKPMAFVCGTIKPEDVKPPGSKVSAKFGEQFPFIFRTYSNPYSFKENDEHKFDPIFDFVSDNDYNNLYYSGTENGRGVKIVQALRATTAAPIYFEPIYIGNDYFYDGGLVANNPTFIALNEAFKIYSGHNRFLFVSLGTGKKRKSEHEFTKSGKDLKKQSKDNSSSTLEHLMMTLKDFQLLIDLVTSSEKIHMQMLSTVKLLNSRDQKADVSYFRFDPPDLGQYDLDCVIPEVVEDYTKKTKEYMNNNTDLDRLVESFYK